jgi:hypothetical protein
MPIAVSLNCIGLLSSNQLVHRFAMDMPIVTDFYSAPRGVTTKLQEMSRSAEYEAKMAELKNAPEQARRLAGFAALLGFLVLLRFCAAALVGYTSWPRAIFSGVMQFLVFWFVGFSIQDRRSWAWWTLLVLLLLQSWAALGHSLRLVRILFNINVARQRWEIIMDWVGMAQLLVSTVVLMLLLSKEVRQHIRRESPKPPVTS